MKLLLLSKYSRMGASSRLRTMQYIKFLEKSGFDIEQQALFNDDYLTRVYTKEKIPKKLLLRCFLLRLVTLFRLYKYDVVWIEYELIPYFPPWFERLLKLIGVKFVVDYDDAIFHNYDLSSNSLIRTLLGDKIDRVMEYATAVVVGNDYLADRARVAGAKSIVTIPTVIDLRRYPKMPVYKNDNLVIGWIGSPATQNYIVRFNSVFSELSKKHDFTLRLVGASKDIVEHLIDINVEVLSWKEDSEVDYIRSFDIGIMPLNDGPWEKGKCGYKLIQYMACSVPVVASPVGINSTIVADNNCGLLANTHSQFVSSLDNLLRDEKQRSTMGKAGRKAVEEHYSVQAQLDVLISLFDSISSSDK
ncbi:glycosyltransferase family 4 protein [Vibrio sp. 10N.261.49.A12]|uniref:glycosyltransferase family 4 protein n=1 Tax=Vibrio sp. 10N.261.49.A12 TaxID=3229667 RepID=UPI00354E8C44